MCRWGYAKKYGFGWNHDAQSVEELAIPRKVSVDNGLITNPFQEKWMDSGNGHAAVAVTTINAKEVRVGNFDVSRTVWEHDGVADIHIRQTDTGDQGFMMRMMMFYNSPVENLVFQLKTTIKNKRPLTLSSNTQNVYQFILQDEHSRFTLLTNWDAKVSSPSIGVMDVSLNRGSFAWSPTMMMRIIVEGIDKVHTGGENATYFFGDMMTKDFFNPLELLFG